MALFNIQNPFKKKDLGTSWAESQVKLDPQTSVTTNTTKSPTTVTAVNVTATPYNSKDFSSKIPSQYLNPTPTSSTPKSTTSTVNPFASNVDTSGITGIYNNQKQQQKNYLDQTTNYLNQVANLNNQALQSQIPLAQDAFNRFKTNTEQSVVDQQAQAERAKMSAEEQFGSAQKQGAMTRQESENRIRNQYAANNAMDSYGAGSYRAASSQLEGQFNQFTQQNIQNKVDQINQIDTEIVRFSNEAKNLIADQEAQLTNLINNINSQVGLNKAEKNYAIQTAQMKYQSKIGEIDAYLQGLEIQKQQLTQEANQSWQLVQSLSPTFKATGQPTTQEDYYFMQTQPDMYEQIFGTYSDRQAANETEPLNASQGNSKALLDSIADIRSIIQTNPQSAKSTKLPFTGQEYDAAIRNASDLIGRLRSGGAINEDEQKTFLNLLPSFWDSQETIDYKLSQLEREAQAKLGQQYSPTGYQDQKLISFQNILNSAQ